MMVGWTRIRRTAGLAALILAASLATLGETVAADFKGVELGRPLRLSTERAVFGNLDCNPMRLSPEQYQRYLEQTNAIVPGARKICMASASIATVPADVTIVLGSNRRVLRITFQFAGNQYARVVEAMTTKWGAGVEEIRDRFDRSIWWDFEDGTSISAHQQPEAGDAEAAGPESSLGLVEYALPTVTPSSDL